MMVPRGAIVAVADGETLNLFRNSGDETDLKLAPIPSGEIDTSNKSSGARHVSSAANPDESQQQEDSFAAGVADVLNQIVLQNKAGAVVVIAAPRTLGELRKHYHKQLEMALVGEIAKVLTGQSAQDIEKALHAA